MAFWNKRKPVFADPDDLKVSPRAEQPIDWEAKFKLAATDLAAQADAIGELQRQLTDTALLAAQREQENRKLRPDALLWRAARDKRSRDRKAAKAGVVS